LAALALLVAAGCQEKPAQTGAAAPTAPSAPRSGGAATPKVTIGIVTNAVAPFWSPMEVGMKAAVGKLPGCEASWQGPQNARVAEQRRLIENYVAQGVKGLAISPLEPEAIQPVIDDLVAKGINVVCIDSDIPTSKRLAYIGTNNFRAGSVLGRKLLQLMGDRPGKAVAFVGTLSAENARDRLEGIKDALSRSKIEIADVKQDNTDKGKARRNVEDTLQAMPDVNILIGLWSYNLPAIAEAVKQSGKRSKITVIGFDAEPGTIQSLKEGAVDATVVQKPYYFGYLAVMLLYEMAVCGTDAVQMTLPKPDNAIDTGVEVIDPKTINAYLDGLKKLGIESS
jgi:ribose transport system substrate-binding protein